MKHFTIQFVGILLILTGICSAGCGPESPEAAFTKMVSTKNVNQDIQLRPLHGNENVFDEGRIVLLLANVSDQLVKFPVDYGIRLFVYDQEMSQWTEIPNQTEYEIVVPEGQTLIENDDVDSQGRIKLHPFGSAFEKSDTTPISATPLLDGLQKPFTLRFVVSGTVDDGDSSENKVSAYYDVYIDQ